MDPGADQFPGHVAGRGGSLARKAISFALARDRLHVRTFRHAIGQLDPLSRSEQHDGEADSNRRNEEQPPIFPDEVHFFHQFHCAL